MSFFVASLLRIIMNNLIPAFAGMTKRKDANERI